MAVEDAVRRDPERLARFGEQLPHHDAGVADVRTFFIGAGPDQLDLIDRPLPGRGVLGESFESDGERGGGEAARLKRHQLGRQRIATILRRPFGDRECGVGRLEAACPAARAHMDCRVLAGNDRISFMEAPDPDR